MSSSHTSGITTSIGRALDQRPPLGTLPPTREQPVGEVIDLDCVRRRDLLGGLIHEYRLGRMAHALCGQPRCDAPSAQLKRLSEPPRIHTRIPASDRPISSTSDHGIGIVGTHTPRPSRITVWSCDGGYAASRRSAL
jgi:hypothetical protein